MSKHRGDKRKKKRSAEVARNRIRKNSILEKEYRRACEFAVEGQHKIASQVYEALQRKISDARLKALICNDLAALKALAGDTTSARREFQAALAIDAGCEPAKANLLALDRPAFEPVAKPPVGSAIDTAPPAPSPTLPITASVVSSCRSVMPTPPPEPRNGIKVAILSMLFNWPLTGGGIIHTVELAQFLGRAGFDVRHFYAKYPDWGAGKVDAATPFPSEPLEFDASTWNVVTIQQRFRQAVDVFAPDYVIITDSWNFKPLLAEAVRGYPYFLRLQAMECICPLNNVRLLPESGGRFSQCRRNQLAEPEVCVQCIKERGHLSGSLHQAERELSGVGTPGYSERLLQAFREAEAVLVVNPLTEALVGPSAKCVRVVTAGMDAARFPWPWTEEEEEVRDQRSGVRRKAQVFFAGLVEEMLKGFHVLHEACRLLWQRRQDFELVATSDPVGQVDEFTRFVGWLSQEELPRHLRAADMLIMPTIAQEALGRTAVEAMAAGRPVIASRLGGLPFTVIDGQTGLLCEPGNPAELAQKIELLIDDPDLRERLGLQGRLRFVREYSWDRIIERHYRPLLKPRRPSPLPLSPHVGKGTKGEGVPSTIKLSLIVSVLDSHEVVRRQFLHLNRVLTPECELILIDDGSEPSLREVCESVAKGYDFRLNFTHDERPWTQPKGRNLGASVARGDKLLFFDIDHILTENIVQTCLSYPGDKLHWVRKPAVLDEGGEIVTSEDALKAHGLTNASSSVHVNSFMIRKELFDLLGGYDEKFCGAYGGDDVDFNSRYARLCELDIAKPDEVKGEGYAYPEPASDQKGLFHSLSRH